MKEKTDTVSFTAHDITAIRTSTFSITQVEKGVLNKHVVASGHVVLRQGSTSLQVLVAINDETRPILTKLGKIHHAAATT